MTLRDVLSTPFVLSAESMERDDGSWVRVLSYPELGCTIAGHDMIDSYELLEAAKLRLLIRAVEERQLGYLPRTPIAEPLLEDRLEAAGLHRWIARLDDAL